MAGQVAATLQWQYTGARSEQWPAVGMECTVAQDAAVAENALIAEHSQKNPCLPCPADAWLRESGVRRMTTRYPFLLRWAYASRRRG